MKNRNLSLKRWISTKLSSATDRTRHYRQGLFSVLVAGIILTGCTTAHTQVTDPQTAEQFIFDQHEVVIGPAKRQTVLTGFLLGGAMSELAVVKIGKEENRRLSIYAFNDSTWSPKLDATLRPEVLFIDVANIEGSDHLITYEPGHLNWFDPESATERELVAVTSNFNPPHKNEIPHVDITRDVNGDGSDDLVIPEVDGFWIFIQTINGAFTDPVKIGPTTNMSGIYGADGYRYDPWSQSRIHEIDYNRDGRGDLVFWNEDHFEVHFQDKNGLFSLEPNTFTTDVVFDSNDIYSLAEGDMTGRVLHSLTDLNGDGVADMVVFSLEGKRISSKHSTYKVHFGKPSADGSTEFAPEIGAIFESDDRIQIGMERLDLGGDGPVGLMFTTIERRFLKGSLWKRIKGAMGDDVWLDLEFYRMEEGRYPDKPNTKHRIALDGVPSHREPGWVALDIVLRGATHERRKTQEIWPRAFNTTLRIADVTGDGLLDLLKSDHPRIMTVFVGVPGPELFTSMHQDLMVSPPNDEEYTWLVDLNNDSKQDIIMHHPFTLRDAHGAPKHPPGIEPHRVTVLIAR